MTDMTVPASQRQSLRRPAGSEAKRIPAWHLLNPSPAESCRTVCRREGAGHSRHNSQLSSAMPPT